MPPPSAAGAASMPPPSVAGAAASPSADSTAIVTEGAGVAEEQWNALSLPLVLATGFVSAIEYSILMPTVWEYLQGMGAPQAFLSLVLVSEAKFSLGMHFMNRMVAPSAEPPFHWVLHHPPRFLSHWRHAVPPTHATHAHDGERTSSSSSSSSPSGAPRSHPRHARPRVATWQQ